MKGSKTMAEKVLDINKTKDHFCELSERKSLNVSGVTDVISFDEGCIVLSTVCGILSVDGEDLRIVSLDVEKGNVEIMGTVNGMIYPESIKKSGGIFRKRQK